MLVRWQLLLTAATAAVVVTKASAASASPSTSSSTIASSTSCRPSEYLCDTGQCVAQDKFCDGEDDCGDKSDEPRYCSRRVIFIPACNRTLFGDVGRTYVVEVRRPREDRLPFLCNLNFTAAGGDLGDLVQLTFDTFTVGRFLSFTSEGCPDGYMTIREIGRPPTGGQWCGSAWGYTVYYSETPSINLTLFLSRLSEQGVGYNFDFKLSYKFLRRSEAHLRYGNSTMATWRGELVNGTYCDRILTRCDTRACRLQSPNYPGVYPRNVTCYYRVEQMRAPPGHRALLAVSQRNSHKIHIKDQIVKYDRSQRILRVWDQCNVVQDYLTVYDGGSTSDRVLVRLCGGDAVPDIVSSHNTMLLEFHTSPYDNPFHPVPLSFLPGFELEVQVLFVDEKSRSFVKENNNCDFYISGYESSSGILENPRHSLAPNTTCRYYFQGKANEIVWISFVKYYAASSDPAANLDTATECNTRLQIWDGAYPSDKQSAPKNISLMGEFCKDDIPRLCDHSLLRNSSRQTRPCKLSESYVSTGKDLTLEHILRQGSALYPISFVLRYEFVHSSGSTGGVPMQETMSCDEVFRSSRAPRSGKFASPKSVFFYGRGGAQNLSCTYRFEADQEQRVQLTLGPASFGDRTQCVSSTDPLVGRWGCDYRSPQGAVAEISVSEYPWPGVRLVRDCLCSNTSGAVSLRPLTAAVVEVRFRVTGMNITQDYRNFFFEGRYQFLEATEAAETGCTSRLEERRLRGTSGEISLRNPLPPRTPLLPGSGPPAEEPPLANDDVATASQCVNEPWLIEPEDSQMNFLYLRTAGFGISTETVSQCATLNRIVVYSAADTRRRNVICPEGGPEGLKTVDFFSDGWNASLSNRSALITPHARSFVVEFLQHEPGYYAVTWMAISKRASLALAAGSAFAISPIHDCLYRCPEIQACINVALWCDGVRHCPSGFDEEEGNCSYRFGVTLLYVAIGAGALGIFAILLLATGCLKYCLYRHRARKKKKNVAINVNNLHVNHTHPNNGMTGSRLSNRYLATPQEMFLDNYGKDSIC
ncbi:uncharacterized protein LOC124302497 isoform X1 [Neodiprion virginianus]|uniref:uncharacterized protein LOC124302497 isoform X1 n=1 Tax=Neodiprion virginianus TaxID=2961670 RepID=UPI001EE6EA65|nr:uncharacterized protein LOC124302497 isoform X1 [Neodiprion virginianus]